MAVLKQNSIFANRYRLDAHLGTGGFSEVWRAVDQMANDAVVVVKVYLPGRGMDETGIKLFSQEYSLVVDLNHPHLLKAMHFDIHEGSPYLILPYCAGGNLFARLQDTGPYDEKGIAEIISQIAGALAYIHEKDIVHQDIKPDNILIKAPGELMLSDFGISFKLRKSMTRTMAAVSQKYGTYYTPYYSPPEKNVSKPGPAGDLFSLGVTLYELATGELPFEFTGKALKEGAAIPPLGGGFSQELDQVLQACMSLEPDFRPSASQLKDWADQYLATGHWVGGMSQSEGDSDTAVLEAEADEQTLVMPAAEDAADVALEDALVDELEGSESIDSNADPEPEAVDDPETEPEIESVEEAVEASDEEYEAALREEMVEASAPAPLPEDKSSTGKLGGTAGWAEMIREAGEEQQEAEEEREARPARNWKPLIVTLLVLVLAGGGGAFWYVDPLGLFGRGGAEAAFTYSGTKDINGEPNGKGKATYANGDVYDGEWKKGLKEGVGKMIYANGNTFEGQYQKGVKSGEGTFTYADNTVYTGEFKNGLIAGRGKIVFPDGEWYEGEFANDMIEGEGAYYKSDSTLVARGTWKKGELLELAK